MLLNVLFASCMSVGGCSAVKAFSVSCVNLSPVCLPVGWYMTVCSIILCVCCQSVLLVVLVRWSEFSAWIVFLVVLL